MRRCSSLHCIDPFYVQVFVGWRPTTTCIVGVLTETTSTFVILLVITTTAASFGRRQVHRVDHLLC